MCELLSRNEIDSENNMRQYFCCNNAILMCVEIRFHYFQYFCGHMKGASKVLSRKVYAFVSIFLYYFSRGNNLCFMK